MLAWLESEITKFWVAVAVGLALKFSFSEKVEGLTVEQARKRTLAGIVAGAAAAFYGTDHVIRFFSIDQESYLLVVIGLVITGEHLVRNAVERGPEIGRAAFDAVISAISKGRGRSE